MSDFDEADKQAVVPSVPKSSNKVVLLGAKVLQTHKEVRKVLPEEKYVDNLEKIIVRDYFPELPKLKAQAEYLEAVARNDHAKIRELQIRYSTRRTDRRTSPSARPSSPKVFDPDTPAPSTSTEGNLPYANEEGDNEKMLKKKKEKDALDGLSVQSYLDKYTSEDNASFEEIAALHDRRERIRNAWMYDAEQRHNEAYIARTKQITAADEQLVAIRNGESDRPNDIDNWAYKARNSVLFHPEDAPLTMAEYLERTKKNQQVINKDGTRFNEKLVQQPHQSAMARAALQQAANNAGHVDVTGKEMGVVNAASLGLVATPTPAPGVDESPLMTWGEIEGTPFRLDGSDIIAAPEDAPIFKIPEVPIRERVAQDIADEIAKRYRQKRRQAMEQAEKLHAKTPKFGSSRASDKLAVMSPAARRLATTKLGLKLGTDKSLKASYSPKIRTPGSAKPLYSPALYNSVKVKKEQTPVHAPENVTDNLFRLPPSPADAPQTSSESSLQRKPRAADFF